MLKALNNVTPRDRRLMLAAITASLLAPSEAPAGSLAPEAGDRTALAVDPEVRDAVLAEIRSQLRLRGDDSSEAARVRVLGRLSEEMAEVILVDVDRRAVRERLGDQGALPADSYRIELTDELRSHNDVMGVSATAIQQAVKMADAVEHVFPERTDLHPNPGWSLFMQRNRAAREGNQYTILVLAERRGETLRVTDAYRLYHSDVELRGALRPMDALRAFAETYGKPMLIGDSTDPVRFVTRARVTMRPNIAAVNVLEAHQGAEMSVSGFFRHSADGRTVDVSLAFALDLVRYRKDLARHGRG